MKKSTTLSLLLFLGWSSMAQPMQSISEAALKDKINGYFIGQLVGNYMGFPFELCYLDEPLPIFVDRYYSFEDDTTLVINRNDLRGYMPIITQGLGGAVSDDDTDIELVTLFAVEKYGLDITYPEITEMWKKHINRRIWVANRRARSLMEEGLVPPATGSKENNEYWWAIDPQLVNEIWSAFYPGMVRQAAERASWGAHITNDDWGTHPTIAYAVMYSAAFFEKDAEKLVQMAVEAIPEGSPFKKGMQDVIRWHKQFPDDWRATRKKIHQNYDHYHEGTADNPATGVSAMNNGLCGIMAVLYGQGDFTKTIGIGVSAGYDCDNQAATLGGLIGVMHGGEAIPERYTLELPHNRAWKTPFNNAYINYSRDELPNYFEISDIVDRIFAVTVSAIEANGGEKLVDEKGEPYYRIKTTY